MREDFADLVKNANILCDKYYNNTEKKTPNPFYIGFGNPNSEILILGKEKGFDFLENQRLLTKKGRLKTFISNS